MVERGKCYTSVGYWEEPKKAEPEKAEPSEAAPVKKPRKKPEKTN